MAGGWQDVTTLLTFYQQPDLDTVLAAMTIVQILYLRGTHGLSQRVSSEGHTSR